MSGLSNTDGLRFSGYIWVQCCRKWKSLCIRSFFPLCQVLTQSTSVREHEIKKCLGIFQLYKWFPMLMILVSSGFHHHKHICLICMLPYRNGQCHVLLISFPKGLAFLISTYHNIIIVGKKSDIT